MVFIGEAGGEDEVYQREGFVGKAGAVLKKAIYISGLAWDEIGRTNVVKRAPDGGYDSTAFNSTFYRRDRIGRRLAVSPTEELVGYRELLQSELLSAKRKGLTTVVACGNEALKTLTGVEGISKYRGSELSCTLVRGLRVVPIMHPSWIIRSAQWQELYITSEIIKRKVAGKLDQSDPHMVRWDEHLKPTMDEVDAFITEAAERGPFTLDIETRASGIACVGLCTGLDGVESAICVPIQTTVGPYFSLDDEVKFWQRLQWLMDQQPMIGHNIAYDLDWLKDYGVVPPAEHVHDTMLLFHRLNPELPKGLDFCTMWLTDIPYYKDDGKTWGFRQPDEKLWAYNVKDVVATGRVWRALQAYAHTQAFKLYLAYTRLLMPVAFEMQGRGMEADPSGVEIAKDILHAEQVKVYARLAALSDGKLVILPKNKKITDKQIHEYLYRELKLKPIINRKTKKPTADEDALVELLMRNPELEVLKAINAERKIGKALNSYINISWRD